MDLIITIGCIIGLIFLVKKQKKPEIESADYNKNDFVWVVMQVFNTGPFSNRPWPEFKENVLLLATVSNQIEFLDVVDKLNRRINGLEVLHTYPPGSVLKLTESNEKRIHDLLKSKIDKVIEKDQAGIYTSVANCMNRDGTLQEGALIDVLSKIN